MNHVPTTSHYDLLARTWRCPAPVAALAFAGDGSAVAFALADGAVAIAATADEEAPDRRIRVSADIGRATIRPRRDPLPPAHPSPRRRGGPADHFRRGGRLPARHGGGRRSHPLGCGRHSGDRPRLRPAGDGARPQLGDRDDRRERRRDHPLQRRSARPAAVRQAGGTAIGPLALSPDGDRVAITEDRTVTITDLAGDAPVVVTLPARPTSIAWRGDGRWIAAPLVEGGFALIDLADHSVSIVGGFPAPVQTVAFSGPAKALVASGAFRIAGWSMETPPLGDARQGALETGRRGFVAVDRIATHPKRKLVAAAYENGQILLAEIGKPDELLVRPAGAPVTAMAWSADGRELAVGAADGTAALIGFPPQMFK